MVQANVPKKPIKDNTALREILNEALKPEPKPTVIEPKPVTEKVVLPAAPAPAPIPLNVLKNLSSKPARNATHSVAGGDRAASAEDMNKLKNLITEKIEKEKIIHTQPKVETSVPVPTPPPKVEEPTPIPKKPKEVPEDVLRKILE